MAADQIDTNYYRAVQSTASYSRPQDAQAAERTQSQQSAAAAAQQADEARRQQQQRPTQVYLLDENLGQHVNILA